MTRRGFACGVLAAGSAAASASRADTLPVLVHDFKVTWDQWIKDYVEFRETAGESPVAELRQWGKVRGAFRDVNQAVLNEPTG